MISTPVAKTAVVSGGKACMPKVSAGARLSWVGTITDVGLSQLRSAIDYRRFRLLRDGFFD